MLTSDSDDGHSLGLLAECSLGSVTDDALVDPSVLRLQAVHTPHGAVPTQVSGQRSRVLQPGQRTVRPPAGQGQRMGQTAASFY